jgi:hypothetical protein
MIDKGKLDDIIELIKFELKKASLKYLPFHSTHEGFAILKEEVDELWDAIRLKASNKNRIPNTFEESLHVAAMIVRFIYDLIPTENITNEAMRLGEWDNT